MALRKLMSKQEMMVDREETELLSDGKPERGAVSSLTSVPFSTSRFRGSAELKRISGVHPGYRSRI